MVIGWIKSNFKNEVDQLISLEASNRDEILTRHAILAIMCALGSSVFQIWFPIFWVAVYAAASLLIHLTSIRLTASRSLTDYLTVLSITFAQLLVYRAMVLYLWFFPHTAAHYISFFMLLAAMRFSTNPKSRIRSYILMHAKGDLTVFAIIGLDFYFRQHSLEGAALLAIGAACMMIYYVVTLCQNLTYLEEKQLLEQSTRQSQKMEAVGRLTGGVAHDFNNILTVVMGNLELHEIADDPDEKRELLKQTREAARRAADLTSQLLAFSRQSQLVQEIQDVAAIFAQVKTLSGRLIPANIKFTQRIEPNISKIRVDATQLDVALLNLIINARDAMPDGGKLSLVAKDQDITDPHTTSKPGPYVCIALTDDGGGIPDDLLDKVIEPFFTTKPVGKGSGLGLSMVKGFAEQSGGFLNITTVPGTSTTVRICLPAVDSNPTDDVKPTPP